MSSVQAYVYDISQGAARAMSPLASLVGRQVDLIPHTGIVCFGTEYFFGSGPCTGAPGNCIGMQPAEILDIGTTRRTQQELENHIRTVLSSDFTPERYNLLQHNCNHYANAVSTFLLGDAGRLPARIVDIADEALGPQGAPLRSMFNIFEGGLRGGAPGMNPFGNVGGSPGTGSGPGSRAGAAPQGLDALFSQMMGGVAQTGAGFPSGSRAGGSTPAAHSGGPPQGLDAVFSQMMGGAAQAGPGLQSGARAGGAQPDLNATMSQINAGIASMADMMETSATRVVRDVSGGGMGGGAGAVRNYETQLEQLRAMGFTDRAACLTCLEATNGDFDRALTMLL